MKTLRDIIKSILQDVEILEMHGNLDIPVGGIHFDSRKIEKNFAFVAIEGGNSDGHQFIQNAIDNGANVVICSIFPDEKTNNVTYIRVANTSYSLGWFISSFYGNPSSKLKLLGVTGTNGKTTVATLLYDLFRQMGYKAGLISTVVYKINDKEIDSTHTTPDALMLNQLLQQMVIEDCSFCFMEVSSHAVVQNRIAGLHFAGGVFTNITHDHLDYHKTFDQYLKAKKTFFDKLPRSSFALVNNDDKNGKVMLQNTKANKYSFGIHSLANFKCRIIESHLTGMLLELENEEVWVKLIGNFNANNALAIYSAATLAGEKKQNILAGLSRLKPVCGRFETMYSDKGVIVIIDYAHTPDALDNVLSTINEIKPEKSSIITIVGAGGDRDKAKRPIMARIAVELSDKVIITSDNPRSENPEDIIAEMLAGVDEILVKKVLCITDRRIAIQKGCMLAGKDDIVLIAGKGHENYQEIKGIKHHFDDHEVVKENLNIV